MKYRSFSRSQIGPKYEKKGLNCQDNSSCYDDANIQIIAIADGHGSNDCFRSDIGSKLAVEAGIGLGQIFLDKNSFDEDEVLFSETGVHNFKYTFWKEWRKLVKAHWDECIRNNSTVGNNEFRYETVSDKYKERYQSDDEDIVNKYLYTAYGTTLILAIRIKKQILILQIGDGTCVVLKDDGSYSCPVPVDDDNFLNVVVSLCEENAYHSIRHVIIDCDDNGPNPVAIFLSSDGLDDCYPVYKNDEHLYSLYSVILDNIINVGFEDTEREIEDSLLPDLTNKGSQDDISLAYMIYEDIDKLKDTYNKIDEEYKE